MTPTTAPRSGAAAAPAQQSGLPHLPLELIEQIAIRIRDVDSMLHFARTCTQFAAVSKIPTFVAALTDAFIVKKEFKIARCDGADTKAARIYDLAREIGSRMKESHLRRLMYGLLFPEYLAQQVPDTHILIQLVEQTLLYREFPQAGVPSYFGIPSYVSVPSYLEQCSQSSIDNRRVCSNEAAVLSAALLSGHISALAAELQDFAKMFVTTVWKHPSDAINALFGTLTPKLSASEPILTGQAALGIWLFLRNSLSSDNNVGLRSHATSMLSWCASQPVAVKIDLMKGIVEWSMTCRVPKPKELDDDFEMDVDEFNGINPEVIALCNYQCYVTILNRSVQFVETLDPELAQRFFAMLDIAVTDIVRRGLRTSVVHLGFAKMLPALPWRENCKAGLLWLENTLRHHEGVTPYSDRPFSGSGEPSDGDEASNGLPPMFAYVYYAPLQVEALKALFPQGVFTDRELAYLVKSISDGTFSWEALDAIDPRPVADKDVFATH